jgi:hypothetical protein
MTDSDIRELRKEIRHAVAKLVGPFSAAILEDFIQQLPEGYHVEGWFFPDHKAIRKKRGTTEPEYYAIVNRLIEAGLLQRGQKMFKARRGIWYKVNFDKMIELVG